MEEEEIQKRCKSLNIFMERLEGETPQKKKKKVGKEKKDEVKQYK